MRKFILLIIASISVILLLLLGSQRKVDYQVVEKITVSNGASVRQDDVQLFLSVLMNATNALAVGSDIKFQEFDKDAQQLYVQLSSLPVGRVSEIEIHYEMKREEELLDVPGYQIDEYISAYEVMDSEHSQMSLLQSMQKKREESSSVKLINGIACDSEVTCVDAAWLELDDEGGIVHVIPDELKSSDLYPISYLSPSELQSLGINTYIRKGVVSIDRHSFSIVE